MKIISIVICMLVLIPTLSAEEPIIDIFNYQIVNEAVQKQNNNMQPMPYYGLSLVLFIGSAEIFDYDNKIPRDITVRPHHNKIRWLCIGKPWLSSGCSSFVVSIHNYIGVVGPQPITDGGIIHFIFVIARDIVIMLP